MLCCFGTVGTLVVCVPLVVAGTGLVPDGAGVPDEPDTPRFALEVGVAGVVAVPLGVDVTLDVTIDVTLDGVVSAGATVTGTTVFPGGNEILEFGIGLS